MYGRPVGRGIGRLNQESLQACPSNRTADVRSDLGRQGEAGRTRQSEMGPGMHAHFLIQFFFSRIYSFARSRYVLSSFSSPAFVNASPLHHRICFVLTLQVRPSLESAQVPYRIVMINDKSFGIMQGNPKVGTFLICLSNDTGNAIVESVVRAWWK